MVREFLTLLTGVLLITVTRGRAHVHGDIRGKCQMCQAAIRVLRSRVRTLRTVRKVSAPSVRTLFPENMAVSIGADTADTFLTLAAGKRTRRKLPAVPRPSRKDP